ncbi:MULTISPECIES: hypothetical protein, partial [Nocardia]
LGCRTIRAHLAPTTYPEYMAKEIDRVRARSALETVKESPFIALVAAVPVIVVLGVVWALTNWFVALLVLVLLGAVVVVRGKFLR